jgi:ribonuclease HI
MASTFNISGDTQDEDTCSVANWADFQQEDQILEQNESLAKENAAGTGEAGDDLFDDFIPREPFIWDPKLKGFFQCCQQADAKKSAEDQIALLPEPSDLGLAVPPLDRAAANILKSDFRSSDRAKKIRAMAILSWDKKVLGYQAKCRSSLKMLYEAARLLTDPLFTKRAMLHKIGTLISTTCSQAETMTVDRREAMAYYLHKDVDLARELPLPKENEALFDKLFMETSELDKKHEKMLSETPRNNPGTSFARDNGHHKGGYTPRGQFGNHNRPFKGDEGYKRAKYQKTNAVPEKSGKGIKFTTIEITATTAHTELYLDNWRQITKDPYVLDCVTGYRLEFLQKPPFNGTQKPQGLISGHEAIVEAEILSLLNKQAIRCVERSDSQYVSRIFVVPKKDDKWRAVLNLKPLNEFIQKHHFKMESWWDIRSLIHKDDFFVRLDLTDAFLSIPMHTDSMPFLCFDWKDKRYQWTRLPFGLTSSPRIFTKVCRPVIAFLRADGVLCFIYLDDLLLAHADPEILLQQLQLTRRLLESLGFKVNKEKSNLIPSKIMQFLGFEIDSHYFTLNLPQTKITGIIEHMVRLMQQDALSGRDLASLIGKLSSASQALLPAPLYFRNLQRLQSTIIHQKGGGINYDISIPTTDMIKEQLRWWIHQLPVLPKAPIATPPVTLVIHTDSSLKGWGAVSNSVSIQGLWSPAQQRAHINILELLAIQHGLLHFAKDLTSTTVQVFSDNTTAVRVLTRLGSIRSNQLNAIATQIWEWVLDHNLFLKVTHIPGILNTAADQASFDCLRVFVDSDSWQLDPRLFSMVDKQWGPHDIDLFADHLNCQTPIFMSWKGSPGSIAMDALAQDWTKWKNPYAFPPFSLIPRVLHQIRNQEITLTLIVPNWTAQVWYPEVLAMLTRPILHLPFNHQLLTNNQQVPHPLVVTEKLRLMACRISAKRSSLPPQLSY